MEVQFVFNTLVGIIMALLSALGFIVYNRLVANEKKVEEIAEAKIDKEVCTIKNANLDEKIKIRIKSLEQILEMDSANNRLHHKEIKETVSDIFTSITDLQKCINKLSNDLAKNRRVDDKNDR